MSVVLLLSRQRSGTGALASVLETHRNIFYCGEILDESCDIVSYFKWIRKNSVATFTPSQNCEYFKKFIDELIQDEKINVVDVKYNSLTLFSEPFRSFSEIPWILECLSNFSIPMINLRRNILETFVSAKLAEKNKVYHTTDMSEIYANTVSVDIGELTPYVRNCRRENEVIGQFFEAYGYSICLDYETTFSSDGSMTVESQGKISSLLSMDLSSVKSQSRFVKQARGSIIDRIENADEVMASLSSIF